MALGVLNNISAVYAENNLNQTQASLQNTLQQLSSGSRINSGADDAAGLSIANGLQANSSALTQSSSNASAGVGFLQVADGALSQVTNLLNRAVTLATEAGGGTLSGAQLSAANQEYQDILTQIGTIGSTTNYNGIQVFTSGTGAATNLNVSGGGGVAFNTPAASRSPQSHADPGRYPERLDHDQVGVRYESWHADRQPGQLQRSGQPEPVDRQRSGHLFDHGIERHVGRGDRIDLHSFRSGRRGFDHTQRRRERKRVAHGHRE